VFQNLTCVIVAVLFSIRWDAFQCISAAVSLLPCSVSNGSVWGSDWVPGPSGLPTLLCCTRCNGYEWNEIAPSAIQHTRSITYAVVLISSLDC